MAPRVVATSLLATGKNPMHEAIGGTIALAIIAGLLYGTRQPKETWIMTGVGLVIVAVILTAGF